MNYCDFRSFWVDSIMSVESRTADPRWRLTWNKYDWADKSSWTINRKYGLWESANHFNLLGLKNNSTAMERFDSNWGTTTDWLIILFGTLSNASLMPKHIWPDIWLWGLHPESPGSAVWLLFCSDSQSSTCSLVRFIMLPTVQSDPNMFYFVQIFKKNVQKWIWMR